MKVERHPVARLFAIAAGTKHSPHIELTRQVWARHFGVSPEDDDAILFTFGEAINLTVESRRAIEDAEGLSEEERDLYLAPVQAFAKGLRYIQWDHKWEGFGVHFAERDLAILQAAAARFRVGAPEDDLDDDEIEALLTAVNDLSRDIRQSNLPSDTIGPIAALLEGVRQAILAVQLRGVEGLKIAIDVSLGTTARWSNSPDSPWRVIPQDLFSRFWILIARVADLSALAGPTMNAIAAIAPTGALPPPLP